MEGLYQWVKSIVFYLILMTMILNLLPDKKYEKYLRLFAGMVLLMLVFEPFGDISGLSSRLAGSFERLTFENDVKLLRREVEKAEEDRLLRLLSGYRAMVEQDLFTMASGVHMECVKAEAEFLEKPEDENFGKLLTVQLLVRQRKGAAEEEVDGGREKRQEERFLANREISELKKKIGEYYGLEEGNITVTLEDQ